MRNASRRRGPALVKLMPPPLRDVLRRQRLFQLLDKARQRRLLWVRGQPGTGKSTAVASYIEAKRLPVIWYQLDQDDADPVRFFSYLSRADCHGAKGRIKRLPSLTPEYAGGTNTFARNFFRDLCGQIGAPAAIVFDNYQAIPEASALHELLAAAAEEIPEGIGIVVISRNARPPAFARLDLHGDVANIGWDELRFTLDECEALCKSAGAGKLDRARIETLHSSTQGWIAGLRLLLEERASFESAVSGMVGTSQTVFDYFATVVFNGIEPPLQRVLFKTALLPVVNARSLRELCAEPDAADLIEDLAQRSCFVTAYPDAGAYQYHPMFRAFLLKLAPERVGADELKAARLSAARLLAAEGDADQAVRLLAGGNEWPTLAEFVVQYAPTLQQQGRHLTLRAWLAYLPDALRETDRWLRYWDSVASIMDDPERSIARLEALFAQFESARDGRGVWLTWSAIMAAIMFQMDRLQRLDAWIARFADIKRVFPAYASKAVEAQVAIHMFSALCLRDPGNADFAVWKRRALFMLHRCDDRSLQVNAALGLVAHYIWRGNFAKASIVISTFNFLLKNAERTPAAEILSLLFSSWQSLFARDIKSAAQIVERALQRAVQTGVRVFDGILHIQGMVVASATANADRLAVYLAAISHDFANVKGGQLFSFQYFSAVHAKFCGDNARAHELLHEAYDTARATGMLFDETQCSVALAFLYGELGDPERVEEYLAISQQSNASLQSHLFDHLCGFLAANLAFDRGERETARTLLRQSLALGKRYGYDHIFIWNPEQLKRFFIRALEEEIEVGFVRHVIHRQRIAPNAAFAHVESWPWPLKIYTLGRFSVLVDDKPLTFSGKAQKKPLELLKVLIALGGKQVREEIVAETLWPEAEGAERALTSALHRLRKLIGEAAIERQEGRLTLDWRHCWIDVWAIERLLAELEQASVAKHKDKIVSLSRQALALYAGAFLASESDAPWALSPRERLRTKLLRRLEAAARALAEASQQDEAIVCYAAAIDIDPLAEALYRGLMQSYFALQRRAEALTTYERCRRALKAELGIAPSAQTDALAQKIKDG